MSKNTTTATTTTDQKEQTMTNNTATPTTPHYVDAEFTNHCGASGAAVTDHGGRALKVYALTPCCKASAKGSSESPTYHVCRACYKPVPAPYGAAGWSALRQAAKDAKCPIPEECADFMLHTLMEAMQPNYRS